MSEYPIYDDNGRIIKVDDSFKHVAFIMDGNGRWAKQKGHNRSFGHVQGAEAFERVLDYCSSIGIKYVTVYAFSTENWKRPKDEVEKIMSLLDKYLDKVIKKADKYGFKVNFIGDISVLSDSLKSKIEKAMTQPPNMKSVLI